jgi:cell division protein FtsZ
MMPKETLAPAVQMPQEPVPEVVEEAASVEVKEAPATEAPQKKSLFQLMTSGLRSQEADETATVSPPPASNDSEPRGVGRAIGGVSAEDRPAPKASSEQLEIPSFLRRQQN